MKKIWYICICSFLFFISILQLSALDINVSSQQKQNTWYEEKIEGKFMIHSGSGYSYFWEQSGFTDCNVTCGKGVQTQIVICKRSDGKYMVDESLCTEIKPLTSKTCDISCNTYEWKAGGFGKCSQTCGGTQKQTVVCKRNDGVNVGFHFCDPKTKPESERSCGSDCYTYKWKIGLYGSCSKTCGGGEQFRDVECVRDDGVNVAFSKCNSPIPENKRTCNMQKCPTYYWKAGGFGKCSATCGGGEQKQTVVCKTNDGVNVGPKNCNPATKPDSKRICNTQECSVDGKCGTEKYECEHGEFVMGAIGKKTYSWYCMGKGGGKNSNICTSDKVLGCIGNYYWYDGGKASSNGNSCSKTIVYSKRSKSSTGPWQSGSWSFTRSTCLAYKMQSCQYP